MSHFTVGVITKNGTEEEVIKALEPFDENVEVDRYIEYTKEQLIEKGKKEIEEYKNGLYSEYLKNPEKYKNDCKNNKDHFKYISEEFPKILNWTDEEIYKDQIEYYNEDEIGEDGEVYSTYNPKSKWDWYEIGGRWNNSIPTNKGKVNTTKISDIIFSKEPTEEDKKIREKNWNHYKKLYKEEYFKEKFGELEEYKNKPIEFNTYSLLLPNGDWLESGKMGWFGISFATLEEEKEFKNSYENICKEYNDYYLTLVDCHI